nr:mitogen-activated protein kinase kinase kinase 5-like isoform X1 [Tanacetum cinerariifolium]
MPLISSLPPFTVGGVDGLLVMLVSLVTIRIWLKSYYERGNDERKTESLLPFCMPTVFKSLLSVIQSCCQQRTRLKQLTRSVQTMFNVLNISAPIPETLSSEGNDFLKRCLQKNTRNIDDRSSAE